MKATRSDNTLMTELEYDSQGRLIASTFTVKLTGTPSVQKRSFEYEDGTLLKQTMVLDGGPTEVTEYEYYTDKPAVVFEYDSINYFLQGEPVPNKYLMKKSSMTRLSDDGYSVVKNISYELNEKGYPTLTTHHVVQSTNSPVLPHPPNTLIPTIILIVVNNITEVYKIKTKKPFFLISEGFFVYWFVLCWG